jgi:hypothetical protein
MKHKFWLRIEAKKTQVQFGMPAPNLQTTFLIVICDAIHNLMSTNWVRKKLSSLGKTILNCYFVTLSVGQLITLCHLVINFFGRAHNNFAKFHYNRIRTNKQENTHAFYFLWTKLIWSIDIVISKKQFFIEFLDEWEFFIGEKQVFTKKKVRHSAVGREFMAVQMRIFSARFLKDPFKLDTSLFESLKELVLLELFLYFWPREQILSGSSQSNFWLQFANFDVFGFALMYNFMLCLKKYTLWGLKSNRKPLESKNGIC